MSTQSQETGSTVIGEFREEMRTTLAHAGDSPERVLGDIWWSGLDEVALVGDADDRDALANSAITLISELDDPASIRTPVNTLQDLLRYECDECERASLDWVITEKLSTATIDITGTVAAELMPLVPVLLDTARAYDQRDTSTHGTIRDAALTTILRILTRRPPAEITGRR